MNRVVYYVVDWDRYMEVSNYYRHNYAIHKIYLMQSVELNDRQYIFELIETD